MLTLKAGESASVLTVATAVPVTLRNIKITGGTGTADDADTSLGGGIYIAHGANVTLDEGALVYNLGTLTLSAGEISGNTATQGSGIFNYGNKTSIGIFIMSGEANVTSDNDVHLKNAVITIAGTLTATAPVATVALSSYTSGTQVLAAATDTGVTLGDEVGKFVLATSASGWSIANDGTLAKQ